MEDIPAMDASVAASFANTASTHACREPGTWARYLDSVAVMSATLMGALSICLQWWARQLLYLVFKGGQFVLDCANLLTVVEVSVQLLTHSVFGVVHLATGVAWMCMMELTSASCGGQGESLKVHAAVHAAATCGNAAASACWSSWLKLCNVSCDEYETCRVA